ncbi:viral A-type inclusion protein, partial [Reticulomyxa filosa]
LNEETKSVGEEGHWNESNLNLNSKNNCNCHFKGKIKDLKDHLDKSCDLIPIKQNIPYEITNQLNVMSKQIKELQDMVKDLQSQLQVEKIQTKQLKHLKEDSLKKNQQAIELKTKMNQTIIDLKKQQNEQNEQWKIKLEELVKTNNKQFDNFRH